MLVTLKKEKMLFGMCFLQVFWVNFTAWTMLRCRCYWLECIRFGPVQLKWMQKTGKRRYSQYSDITIYSNTFISIRRIHEEIRRMSLRYPKPFKVSLVEGKRERESPQKEDEKEIKRTAKRNIFQESLSWSGWPSWWWWGWPWRRRATTMAGLCWSSTESGDDLVGALELWLIWCH